MTRFLSFLLPLALMALSGCAALTEEHDPTKDWTVEEFYANAREALDSGNYQSAIDLYGKLEARYPYGNHAQQAQLETAYAHYKANEPAAAIAAAERFMKLHPRNPNVDYAYYIRGLASFQQGQGLFERFFEDDDAHKRDPRALREAFNYFKELVTRFPDSQYRDDSAQRMLHLRNLLARYEVEVARFYRQRGAHLATANRAKYVVEHYPQTPSVPNALGLMVRAYRDMEMQELAADALRVLESSYPDHPALVKLRQIPATGPDTTDEP